MKFDMHLKFIKQDFQMYLTKSDFNHFFYTKKEEWPPEDHSLKRIKRGWLV